MAIEGENLTKLGKYFEELGLDPAVLTTKEQFEGWMKTTVVKEKTTVKKEAGTEEMSEVKPNQSRP